MGDDYARIVVAEQNRQFSAPAGSVRRGGVPPMSGRSPQAAGVAPAAAAAATQGPFVGLP